MKNDLWYAGEGFWVVYCEDAGIITEFKKIKALQESAVYFHYRGKGKHASQFKFQQGEPLERGKCLLSYVCARLHFDFSAALELYRNNDSTPYLEKYPVGFYQLELFPEYYLAKPAKTRSRQ
ncbi:MAG: hypothetical protein GX949_00240 [Peptococcaceae bacterium]|jgi:hypothetical protein|nr:hypothetical protein [Peptococcaceae bacterium]